MANASSALPGCARAHCGRCWIAEADRYESLRVARKSSEKPGSLAASHKMLTLRAFEQAQYTRQASRTTNANRQSTTDSSYSPDRTASPRGFAACGGSVAPPG